MRCRVFVTGKELPGKRVVLQICLNSNLSVPLSLLSFDLTPQPGFGRDPAQLGVSSLLPLEVCPLPFSRIHLLQIVPLGQPHLSSIL